jgi:sugar lactone lactonase YvrE
MIKILFPLILIAASGCAKQESLPPWLSPESIVASKDGKSLYVAEVTGRQVVELTGTNRTVANKWSLPAAPTGLALSPDNKQLAVSIGTVHGEVRILDLQNNRTTATLRAGHTPIALRMPKRERCHIQAPFTPVSLPQPPADKLHFSL